MSNKILIVDDEKNIRLTLKKCLEDQQYEISIATNGEEGISKIKSEKFDLVMLDIKMPGLNGMQVLKEIRDKGINVNVIMMTAYGTIEKAVEAMKLGAIDFISKPFTPEEVRVIVKEVLERQEIRVEEIESKDKITYKDALQYGKKCLQDRKYSDAEEYLKKAIGLNVDAPEPHNLLGILLEYKNNIQSALNHYRVALSLDAAYKPAQHNLDRATEYMYTRKGIDFGDDNDDV
ncbi:alkaline phosphatase synthesis transcriptional regulatory protein PhoP [Clostridium homopropionicum DSM 5847]|uniref:Stage 0 sporulation protein A homolog n=1 Tax=Clostridium homopropionicum DSM 5847 TaxID=1121318 RepID=A0A0L6ZCZ4_9CLOT|nr:response regulator [Clostridium homopropionicum]KOA20849.1 alkaline phosphatase synthesis transcriptional regulatory protein PhoP [Clostridium homopropionicum DSM 5847]SFF87521.1 TPR repeat-containing protein [Clostridium homopropionicum]